MKVGTLVDLHPIAEHAARIIDYIAQMPAAIAESDSELSGRIGQVSAQHAATVKRVLVEIAYATECNFSHVIVVRADKLARLAAQLEGVASYRQVYKDRDVVRLVVTEPGSDSALRAEVYRRFGLPPVTFQTLDGFINLARSARTGLRILMPFMDDEGAEFLLRLFSLTGAQVQKVLICRPLSEKQCGPAFRKREVEFRKLGVVVYEYARPSSLRSGRETFHAKVVLADDVSCYIGSSNMMGSALERSFEVGVIVSGRTAAYCDQLLDAVLGVASRVNY